MLETPPDWYRRGFCVLVAHSSRRGRDGDVYICYRPQILERGTEVTAIANGLAPGAVVVSDGADKLREGGKVELPGEAPATASPSADGQKQWGRGQGRRRDQDGKPADASGSDAKKPKS